ncbi:Dephospho-CoA kinase [Meiothermus luteus]|uniref:Dephospho-CoA kinase n=1 Tax=Meiothermus luteus TaxID=2026184 RepID=A0A399EE68_9DEIN|nr:dephospho-CoA kinase [Meiothermus luteus]RIH81833.1 Dephospho-CoA kinase [Meiothermus luteus]RMH57548.1 MAG: dephospho-CoA kinase [Deinococcota bacterium]
MRLVGLTGSIGSGKSTVAGFLRERGVPVLDADALAREGAEVFKGEICRMFPEACRSGEVDRRALGALVFADMEARRRLEGLLHPYVRARLREETERARAEGVPLLVQEIPLLFEAGREREFDGVLVVAAPEDQRRRRVVARGLSEAEFEARDRAQLPQEEKLRRATWVIWNEADLETLRARVAAWLEEALK